MRSIERHIVCLLIICIATSKCSDITPQAFGDINDAIIAAFGDFNSDELTDVLTLSTDGREVSILLASYVEQLLRRSDNTRCTFTHLNITSIIPGDFDGDAFMDVLVTSVSSTNSTLLDIYINWGGLDTLHCADENEKPLFRTIGEPMALDYNQDMIIDLFGVNEDGVRTFWIFEGRTQVPKEIIPMNTSGVDVSELIAPNSNAFLDLNNDFKPDLFLETKNGFEVWLGGKNDFTFGYTIKSPKSIANQVYGNSIFLDVELNGSIAQILPMCHDASCHSSAILAYVNGEYYDLQVDFRDEKNQLWTFINPKRSNQIYQKTIALRGGDFNLDGYPDLLVTLNSTVTGRFETFLMENIECSLCEPLTRSFKIRWNAFSPYGNGTVMGAFYDFLQVGSSSFVYSFSDKT